MSTSTYRVSLLRKRHDLLAGDGAKRVYFPNDTNTRHGDLADQSDGTNEVHIQVRVKMTDAKVLQAIEEALQRMDQGTYGLCRDCGERIASARLDAIPWTRVCLSCKEQQRA